MPDRRTKRGAHPKDEVCFESKALPKLRQAVADLSWLRSKGYSNRASLTLVGDRYSLRDRQRKALQRCAAGDDQVLDREQRRVAVDSLANEKIIIDGYNVILSLEAALCGGVLMIARDGALRDLAAMSNHYRRVHATRPAIELLAEFLDDSQCSNVQLLLDRPVSNSGRLRVLITETVSKRSAHWEVLLTDRTDQTLIASPDIVATADSAVLDRCNRWFNLARTLVEDQIPDAWVVDLGQQDPEPAKEQP